MRKILITGATGFIGSHLAKSLSENGDKIRCLVRETSPQPAIEYLDNLGAELAYGDLLDKKSLENAVSGIDAVFHLGGGGRVGMSKDVQYKINVDGTRNLLDACAGEGIKKFVHVSTCAVMGNVKGNKPADETYPYNPSDIAYSKAKTEAEKIALSYSDRIPLVVVRFPGVYGPPLIKDDAGRIDGVTPALMIFSSIKNGQWMYIGGGKNLVHLVYIDDAICGLELAEEKGNPGEIYIIGGQKSVGMDEMVGTAARMLNTDAPKRHVPVSLAVFFAMIFEARARLFGGTPRMSKEMITGFTANMNIDVSKARRKLGYESRIGLEEGMKKAIKWYKENKYL